MTKTCRIELIYRIWDDENGGSVTIQEDGELGVYDLDGVKFTVEQIPGIIEALTRLEQEYKDSMCDTVTPEDLFTPEAMARERQRMLQENANSGRPDPPF